MLKLLVRNTLFTGLAHLSVGLIGFLLVPYLVKAYGLVGFGLIVLVRVFLPTGPLSLFDFGVSETATQSIARARADGSWQRASGQTTLLFLGAAGLGALVALLLAGGAPMIAGLLEVPPAERAGFDRVAYWTALASPLLFAGLVVEGATKGFERYDLLRSLEILSAAAFAGAALLLVRQGRPWHDVALAFLASQGARGVALLLSVWPLARSTPLRPARWDRDMFLEVRRRGVLLFQSRALGVLQFQSPPLLIGFFVGPAGVGAYDIVVRLPRFVKSVLALLISALLPVSARLDAARDGEKLRALGRAGYWLMPALAYPPLAAAVFFSPEFLREWVGPSFAGLWPWFALMFAVPLMNVLLSYGQTLMQVRLDYLKRNNRLLAVQAVLQMGLSLGLVRWWGERAFLFGQVAAMGALFPWVIRALTGEQGLAVRDALKRPARMILFALPLGAAAMWARGAGFFAGPLAPLLAAALLCALHWAAIGLWVVGPEDRNLLYRAAGALLRRSPPAEAAA